MLIATVNSPVHYECVYAIKLHVFFH